MPRRVNLPGASELFRPTEQARSRPLVHEPPQDDRTTEAAGAAGAPTTPAVTGRVRHDEKITVYVSGEELLALEQARLRLRAEHRLGVDRGRIVRAAVALALADLAEHGADSDLVRRLADT